MLIIRVDIATLYAQSLFPIEFRNFKIFTWKKYLYDLIGLTLPF